MRATAIAARKTAIRVALNHARDTGVWIIHADPRRDDRIVYRRHRATMVHLDPGRDVVEARACEQRPPEAMRWIAEWYAKRGPL